MNKLNFHFNHGIVGAKIVFILPKTYHVLLGRAVRSNKYYTDKMSELNFTSVLQRRRLSFQLRELDINQIGFPIFIKKKD